MAWVTYFGTYLKLRCNKTDKVKTYGNHAANKSQHCFPWLLNISIIANCNDFFLFFVCKDFPNRLKFCIYSHTRTYSN